MILQSELVLYSSGGFISQNSRHPVALEADVLAPMAISSPLTLMMNGVSLMCGNNSSNIQKTQHAAAAALLFDVH